MKYIEKVDEVPQTLHVALLESEIRAMAPIVVAAQKLAMRRIVVCPLNCDCYFCQLEQALAENYTRCN